MSEIKNIIFDLGGVILNLNYGATAAAFNALGLNNFDDFYNQKQQTELFNNFEKGLISEEIFIEKFKRETALEKLDIIKAWNAMLLNLPAKRLHFIKALKNHYSIFLLSNTNEIHIKHFEAQLLQENNFSLFKKSFHKIYYSCRMHNRKPDLVCFQKVLNENSLKANETLFIDDSIQHIKAAQKLEIKTYLMEQNKSIIDLFPGIIQSTHR
jgi:putative hydrolase of the HAD superfamily